MSCHGKLMRWSLKNQKEGKKKTRDKEKRGKKERRKKEDFIVFLKKDLKHNFFFYLTKTDLKIFLLFTKKRGKILIGVCACVGGLDETIISFYFIF